MDVNIVDRRNIIYPDGKYDEINIYAEGMKNGKISFIIGECKAQPGKKDIDKFCCCINVCHDNRDKLIDRRFCGNETYNS